MKKRTRNVLIATLIIFGIVFISTLMIPLFQGKRINPNTSYQPTSIQKHDREHFRLDVAKGEYYKVTIQWGYTGMDPSIALYYRSLKLYGIYKNPPSYQISIRFQAKHSGFYYVTVDTEASIGGDIYIYLEQTSETEYYAINYYHTVNIPRVLFYSISAILCVLTVILPPFGRFLKRKLKEYEENPLLTCPDCGAKIRKRIGFCARCGHTFESPKTNKY